MLTVRSVPLDILVHLVQHSEFRLLAAWRRTSTRLYRAVGAHLENRYHACLRPFVHDVPGLSRLLVQHGAVVSGSVALRYFLPRATWVPNDMDIYVPDSEYEAFVTSVTDPHGLRFSLFPNHRPWEVVASPATTASTDAVTAGDDDQTSPPRTNDEVASSASIESHIPSSHPGIREVRKFYSSTDCRIDVIRAPTNNPVLAIKQFWSPLLMNFLRPDACMCGFPLTTLEGIGALKASMSRRDAIAAAKYIARGFTLAVNSPLHDDDYWEDAFFGSRSALAMPYRRHPTDSKPPFPVVHTDRGWAFPASWPRAVGEYTYQDCTRPTILTSFRPLAVRPRISPCCRRVVLRLKAWLVLSHATLQYIHNIVFAPPSLSHLLRFIERNLL